MSERAKEGAQAAKEKAQEGKEVVVPLVLSGYTEEHDGGRNDTNPELPTLQQ